VLLSIKTIEFESVTLDNMNVQKNIAPYAIRQHPRAKYLRISVYPDGRVVLTKPKQYSMKVAEKFYHQKKAWIDSKIEEYKKKKDPNTIMLGGSVAEYRKVKEEARTFIHARIEQLNLQYGFSYNTIYIKNHKSLWGSCSSKKNLNFNYRILFLPQELSDYIVVHELCHLKELNHSKKFWALVEKGIPDYKKIQKQLKRHVF
jgi:predicted metal-dependent hydrolase